MRAPKRPSFPWYPGDHRRDTNVQGCSYAARGLWGEMMNLMHDGEPYGHLTTGGKGMTDAQLASMTGGQLPLVRKLLKELAEAKVYTRTATGVIYCRRMVKDEATRRQKKANGKLGGNPRLLNHEDNQQDIHPLNQPDNHPPAVAVAVAVASPSTHPAIDEFLNSLPEGQNEQRWRAIVEDWQSGLGVEGGKPATPDDVAVGLTEYMLQDNRDFSAVHVRSYVERARRNRLKSADRGNGVAPSIPRTNGKRKGPPEYDYSKTTDRPEDIKWQ